MNILTVADFHGNFKIQLFLTPCIADNPFWATTFSCPVDQKGLVGGLPAMALAPNSIYSQGSSKSGLANTRVRSHLSLPKHGSTPRFTLS